MAEKKKKKKQGVGTFSLFLAILFAIGAVMMMATTMVFVVGMVPTAVAFFSDTSKSKTAGLTIGSMNFAGVLPAILELWSRGHSVDIALNVISEPLMLLYMYGGAGISAFLYVNLPPIISVFLRAQAKHRIKKLEDKKQDLLETWGPKVADAN